MNNSTSKRGKMTNSKYRNVLDIIEKAVEKDKDGDNKYIYIFRGEPQIYPKVSSGWFRDIFEETKLKDMSKEHGLVGKSFQDNVIKKALEHTGQTDILYKSTVSRKEFGELCDWIRENIVDNFNKAYDIERGIHFDYFGLPDIDRVPDYGHKTEECLTGIDSRALASELQHFGCLTNLIDFTEDLLIAIFFSCHQYESNSKESRVIMLKMDNSERLLGHNGPYHDVPAWKPSNPSERVVAQKSVFIEPVNGFIEVAEEDFIRIPHNDKKIAMEYLKKYHNISEETVYNGTIGFIANQKNNIPHLVNEIFQQKSLHYQQLRKKMEWNG